MFEPTTLSVYTAATPVFLAIVADPGLSRILAFLRWAWELVSRDR